MLVAVPATPVKPTTPAMRAMTKNVMAQLNIRNSPLFPSEKDGRFCSSGRTYLPSVDGVCIPRFELRSQRIKASLPLYELGENSLSYFER